MRSIGVYLVLWRIIAIIDHLRTIMWTRDSSTNNINNSSLMADVWPHAPGGGFGWPKSANSISNEKSAYLKELSSAEVSTTVSASATYTLCTNCEVFVGGIPTHAPDQEVEQVFSRFGKILACRLMRRQDGASRGFAFITYAIPQSALFAVSCKNKVRIRGKLVEIRAGLNIHESRKYRAQLQNRKIYIGNLPSNVTENEVRELFGEFGRITEIKLVREPLQMASPIYGFVTFEDCQTVHQVLNLPVRLHLKGRKVQCKLTIPKEHPHGKDDVSESISSTDRVICHLCADQDIVAEIKNSEELIDQASSTPFEMQDLLLSAQSKNTATNKTSVGSSDICKFNPERIARIEKWKAILLNRPTQEDSSNYRMRLADKQAGLASPHLGF
jgi:RNA recognition motif-containing protein